MIIFPHFQLKFGRWGGGGVDAEWRQKGVKVGGGIEKDGGCM